MQRCGTLALLILSAFIAGCHSGRTASLVAEVEQLRIENDRLQAALDEKESELTKVNQTLEQYAQRLNRFGDARDLLSGIVEQYGEGLTIIKDLGLPEADGFSVEDLLGNLNADQPPMTELKNGQPPSD